MRKTKFILPVTILIVSMIISITSCSIPGPARESSSESNQNVGTKETNNGTVSKSNFKYDITTERGLIDTINDKAEYDRIVSEAVKGKQKSNGILRAAAGGATLGDINGDGIINIIDTLLVAQYSVNLVVNINKDAADVNGDSKIDMVDALLIAKYVVGLIDYSQLIAGSITWTTYTTTNGLGHNLVNDVYVSGSTIYAATWDGISDGISISKDNGSTWSNLTTMPASEVNGNKVYVFGSTIYYIIYRRLYTTNDNGVTWNRYDDKIYNPSSGYSGIINVVYASGSNIYAATISGLFVSKDNGTTWTRYTTANGLANNDVWSVYVSGSTIYAATESGLSVSKDNCATWTNYTTTNGLVSNRIFDVFVSGSTIYAATYSGLSVSKNNGATWTNYTKATLLMLPDNTAITDLYVSGSIIYVAHHGGLSVSKDNGTTWTNYIAADGFGNINWVHGVYVSGSTIYAATDHGLLIGQIH